MPIVFSAFTPHPPILIPGIGKDNLNSLKKTIAAYNILTGDLYSSYCETILIISPHGPLLADIFTMNLMPEFIINFEKFGDLATKFNLKGDTGLAHKIKEELEPSAKLQLISEEYLDHGAGVPLYLLTRKLPYLKIIPIYYSGFNLEEHFNFGQLIRAALNRIQTKVAIIASGDLSHRLTKNAPAGFSPKGAKFDKKLIEYLKADKVQSILKMNPKLINEAGECGLKSLVMLLGILDGLNYQPHILSYEAPFGVGYLTAEFKL